MKFRRIRHLQTALRSIAGMNSNSPENEDIRWNRLRWTPSLLTGAGMLGFILTLILLGQLFGNYSASELLAGPRLSPPSLAYWFGTDGLGRDLFSRVIQGLQVSLSISVLALVITAVPGILFGLIAGYFQGWVDHLLSRLVDVLLSLPGLLLAIVLIARLGPSLETMILALGITGIPTFFRVTRNETMCLTRELFVVASHSIGVPGWRILIRHILPNMLSTLLALTSMRLGIYLLMGSGLSFIGLGVKPPLAELGALLASGKEFYHTAWWLMALPGSIMVLTVMGLNMMGEGIRDQLH